MRCFYHQDKEAVGSCRSCGKGLCSECALDLGKGLACRSRCEEDVRAVIQLVERNIKMEPAASRLIQAGGSARLAAALFYLVCGGTFFFFGFLNDERFIFAMVLGGCLMAYGVFALLWNWKTSLKARK